MRFFFKPPHWRDSKHKERNTWKDASICGYFHFGLVISRKVKPDISGFPNFPLPQPKTYLSIMGWYWPMGISVSLFGKHFTWYSKRYMDLKRVQGGEWIKSMPVHWYGLFGGQF